jgi:hypothetical protein
MEEDLFSASLGQDMSISQTAQPRLMVGTAERCMKYVKASM